MLPWMKGSKADKPDMLDLGFKALLHEIIV